MIKLIKATELIAMLQGAVERHGDLPVGSGGAVDTGWVEPVRDVKIVNVDDRNGDFGKEGGVVKMIDLKLCEYSYEAV